MPESPLRSVLDVTRPQAESQAEVGSDALTLQRCAEAVAPNENVSEAAQELVKAGQTFHEAPMHDNQKCPRLSLHLTASEVRYRWCDTNFGFHVFVAPGLSVEVLLRAAGIILDALLH